MPRIAISYRRADSGVITGRIFDRLVAHYGRESVYRDIDNAEPGIDFRKPINEALEASDVILAIVGPKWVGPRANQSRLTNAADPVRMEIETALSKDKPLIPVLVQRATMPRVEQLPESMQDFAYRHAVTVDAGQDFDMHMGRLIRSTDRILGRVTEVNAVQPAVAPISDPGPQFESNSADQELEDLKAQLESAHEAAADLGQERDELKNRLEQIESEANSLRERQQTFETEMKSAAEEAARAKDQIGDRTVAAERQAAYRIRAQVQQIEAQAKTARDDLAQAQAELYACQVTITQREAEVIDLREANRVLEVKISELTAAQQEESEKAAKLRDEVSTALLHREQEAKNLSERLSAAQQTTTSEPTISRVELEELTRKRDQLERQFHNLTAENRRLRERNIAKSSKARDLADMSNIIDTQHMSQDDDSIFPHHLLQTGPMFFNNVPFTWVITWVMLAIIVMVFATTFVIKFT